jgi:hypothetical protein
MEHSLPLLFFATVILLQLMSLSQTGAGQLHASGHDRCKYWTRIAATDRNIPAGYEKTDHLAASLRLTKVRIPG